MPDNRFLFGYFSAKRSATPWRAGPRTHPKMPSRPWRTAAVICTLVGAAGAWLLFRNGDSGALVLRVIVGGLAGLAIGMYVVETVWERRTRRRLASPPSPIGRRR